jgi:hypothetical protein
MEFDWTKSVGHWQKTEQLNYRANQYKSGCLVPSIQAGNRRVRTTDPSGVGWKLGSSKSDDMVGGGGAGASKALCNRPTDQKAMTDDQREETRR